MDVDKNRMHFVNVTALNLRKSCQYSTQQFSFVRKNLLLCCQIISQSFRLNNCILIVINTSL